MRDACFEGLHVSVRRALEAFGVESVAARALVDQAGRAGRREVRVALAETPDRDACMLIVRRMRGNHAEAWTQPIAKA